MSKNTFVINLNTLLLGGIEKYLYRLSKYLIRQGYRVVWLCDSRMQVFEDFKDVFLSTSVERYVVNCNNLHWFKHPSIPFGNEENIVIVSFTPVDMAMAEQLMIENPQAKITPLYIIPNVTGNRFYIERCFPPVLKELVKSKMNRIISRWVDMDVVRFFSITQIRPLTDNYELTICDPESKTLRDIEGWEELDEIKLIERMKRKEFNIVTVGRFDFPHKGYMLGLVRAFGRLKPQYPQLYLHIVGYGKDEHILRDEVKKLPKAYRSSVYIEGAISPDNLGALMSKMNLNISCAGAVSDGSRFGVLSIPARNFCEGECQVYGYLPENRNMATSLEPGKLVDSYIEEVINMPDKEYIKKCKESYFTYKDKQIIDPLYLFHTHDENKLIVAEKSEINFLRCASYGMKFFNRSRLFFQRMQINNKK